MAKPTKLTPDQIECAAMRLFLTDLPRRHRDKVLPWAKLREHERDYYRWVVRLIFATALGEDFSEKRKVGIKHGYSYLPEYRAWLAVKSRCLNTKVEAYAYYGARGITICAAWVKDFPAFFKHVGPRPSPEYSLDRYPDNDGNYEPGNVRWATDEQQQANRRTTIWVTLDGEKIPLAEACRRLDINSNTVWMRMRRGISADEALALVRRVPQRKRIS